MSRDQILKLKLERLYSRRTAGIKFGLDVQETLMSELGNPQESYACIHVAGTNGKGSVCAMLGSVLKAVGIKVGIYTSPHLVEFNERIVFDGIRASDDELLDAAALVDASMPSVASECGREASFFEYATAMAMKHFETKGAQVVVLETGMGGRLDATNIVTPLVSVITRIACEHIEFLGDTIEKIAGEKAGIIKAKRPIVCGAMPAAARHELQQRAGELGCLFRDVESTVSVSLLDMSLHGMAARVSTEECDYGRLSLKILGLHQLENLATAVASLEEIQRALGVEFDEQRIRGGIESAQWDGRFQVLSYEPPLIVDGAHNPDAAAILAKSLRKVLEDRPLGLIIGMCGDKDIAGFLNAFHGIRKVWAVTIRNERAVPAAKLQDSVRSAGIECEAVSLSEALAASRNWAASNNGAVCVTGSLFLVGEVLEQGGLI